jgi:hypothetical protein
MNEHTPQNDPSDHINNQNHPNHLNGPSWFEKPTNVRNLIIALAVACAVLVLADFVPTSAHRESGGDSHPRFAIETSFGFHAWFGFVAFVAIVFLGRLLRMIVSRPEEYYHDNDC